MKVEHIQFEEWEQGEPLDQEHLATCTECREKLEQIRFLSRLASTAPEVEIPVFFPSRVAQLAVSGARGFWEVLDLMARRMVPIFAALVLVVSFFLLSLDEAVPPLEDTSLAWLAEAEGKTSPNTLDDMLILLAEAEREENGDAEQY